MREAEIWEKILKAKGKRLVGWDEIHDGGLAPEANVMSWRGTQGGIQAAQQGLDEGQNRILTMYILKSFFALPYDGRDFYVQFEERMKKARQDLAMD